MTAPVHARLASTVALVRAAAAPVEVLLLRRHADLAFLGGTYVFPGGRVDDDDAEPGRLVTPGEASARIPGVDGVGEATLRVAGIRELVEESGILLARRDGAWATADEARSVRDRIATGTPFAQVVADDGWVLATDTLVPFGWIVTPRAQPKRFDTHFLLAELPPGQEASHDDGESDDLVWIDPAEAIDPTVGDPLPITPPTWFTLALLAQHRTLRALRQWAGARVIERIEPVLALDGERRRVTFPNDPLLARWHGPDGIVFDGPVGSWRFPSSGA